MTVEFNGKIYELEQEPYGTNNFSNTYEALAHDIKDETHHVMVVWDVINPSGIYETSID